MFCKGEYRNDKKAYGVICSHTKRTFEAMLINNGVVESAYKKDETGEYAFGNVVAKEMATTLLLGIRGCTSKNGNAMAFELGVLTQHEFIKTRVDYLIQLSAGELCGCDISGENQRIELLYDKNIAFPSGVEYIKLTTSSKKDISVADGDDVIVRSVNEIALEKDDITWLKNKKYYIVNDDEKAEQIFSYLDNYDGVIAYDTETTGLRINCFGKINSSYQRELEQYNKEHPNEQLRADKLVGIIYCIEPNVSYYFPCGNRKFKNLYDDKESPIRKRLIEQIKAKYTVGELRDSDGDMADYVRKTAPEDFTSDVILMERNRHILTTKHIVPHGGSFEWKVDWLYEIDTNIKDDTMILHQIMYKFRSTTRNSGEPSNLKYLAKVELGIDQWELNDFFPDFKEDDGGEIRVKAGSRKKKQNSKIDFSYMDYEGTRVYAPTDGDVTLQLYLRYKKDMIENHPEQVYIYNVEILVECAIGYMEFYGHRINEDKILGVRDRTKAKIVKIESQIRQLANYSSAKELEKYNELIDIISKSEKDPDNKELLQQTLTISNELKAIMDNDETHPLNLASPAQVADLFYVKMGIPFKSGEKMSVAKGQLKGLLKEKNEDGSPKYPIVHLYSDYKKEDTLVTKFFDNLPYFMYPGGIIFSHYGQISTATGRMSCNKPNAQQYPKTVTSIVEPRDGYVMMDADYSQIEYRVLVALSNNTKLAELFSDPDSDYHTLMASLMYGVPYASVTPKMRGDAKSFNFGIPYGMGLGSLAILLTGVNTQRTRDEAAEKYELYFKDQPMTRKFFDQVKEMAQVKRYTKTFWNRYRYYSFTDADGNENNAKKAAALRQAGNAVIQGCLHGDTRIQTKEFGIMKIKDLVGYSGEVWNGEKWTHGDVLYSGKKRKCIITFSNGQKFICSPTHKFLVKSSKGNERFIECQNLRGSEKSTNPHRVVVSKEFCNSDFKYSSEWAYKYKTNNHKSNNAMLEDIGDSFGIGVVLGRLASDGSILDREVGGSNVIQYIAEHEENIVPILCKYMSKLGCQYTENEVREDRTERVNRLTVYSKSLTKEIKDLDIKHKMDDNIFMDTKLLRGFLRGMFDGDGGISGKTIALTFGTQFDSEEMCRDIQRALLFFGIRSRYYKYEYRSKITIKTNDNERFLDLIGFINKDKQESGRQLECIREEKLFGRCLVVESVEITDEYIDMYDVCNTDEGYYVADGIITHNTAADIFKISVARNFMYIRENNLLGDLLIVNMVHDEQLMEVNVKKLNMQRVLRDVGINMQFKINGFPPLYIGAGIGPAWGKAKGKMAEIHPNLLEQLSREADVIPLRHSENESVEPKDVLKYFEERVLGFRRQKVIDYITNPDNFHQTIHPAIGGLINLQFNYGRGGEAKAYMGGKYTDEEFLLLNLADFIAENNLDVKAEWFKAMEAAVDEEEDEEYDEREDGELDEIEDEKSFSLIDESNKFYGSSLQDIISIFGTCVLDGMNVCGIDMRNIYYKKKDAIIDYIATKVCDESDSNALEVVYLLDGNVLNHTGVYVSGLNASKLEGIFKANNNTLA